MKTVSNDFINTLKSYGKLYECIIEQYQHGTLVTENDKKILTEDDLHYLATENESDNNFIEIHNEEIYEINPITNGNLLRSNMKCTNFKTTHQIRVGTKVRFKFILQLEDSTETLTSDYYYIAEKEYDEATGVWSYISYDAILFSMIEYTELQNGTFPMTVEEYLSNIALDLGLTYITTNFANYNKTLQIDPYKNLGYTYREILDEISAVAGGSIIVKNNQLQMKYITVTSTTFNEDWFKNINVNFSKKYGPVNSLVFSRSAESDNVYIQDTESIQQNGLCEIKLIDNQILNNNDRADYLSDLFYKLNNLEYYINDFETPGILILEFLDSYNCEINGFSYNCLLLNDEVTLDGGISEHIYTEEPEQTTTDYTKADKTDRRINQTYLIVDKQNQIIESVVSNVTEQDSKISQITQTVDELTAQISDISDITTYGESSYASVELSDVNESEPIMIKVYPINNSIRYLHPRTTLYPSATQYLNNRHIKFTRTYTEGGTTHTQDIYYELPDDLLYYDSTHYDEFYLDYESQTCQITKRCGYNADGTIYALQNEVVNSYTYPSIILGEGNYTITLPSYSIGYLYVRLMAKNIYTTQFYTKAETNSLIQQTTNNINLSVNQKLTNYSTTLQMNSAINIKANEITSNVSETYATKTALNQTSTTLSSQITQTSNSITAEVTRATNAENTLSGRINLKIDKTDNGQIISMINASADRITLTAGRLVITSGNFKLDSSGNMTATNGNFSGTVTTTSGKIGNMNINSNGIYMFGSNNYDGFGLWKSTAHQSGDSYIIFHSGGNSAHIGDAQTRIYLNGKISTSQIVFDARDANNGSLVGTPLRIRAVYNTTTQRPQGQIDITTGDFGIIDDTYGSREVPFMISTLNKWVSIGEPNYNFTALYNGRNLYYVNDTQYGGNIVTAAGIDHQIMIGWTGSQLAFIVDNQVVRTL